MSADSEKGMVEGEENRQPSVTELFVNPEQLQIDHDNLHAAHTALLKRIQDDGEHQSLVSEISLLQGKNDNLQEKLQAVTSERDELYNNVRDLRVRVEEGRRALMRLQGQQPASGSVDSSVDAIQTARTVQQRKATAPAPVLSSWNPMEMNSHPSESVNQATSSMSPEEVAELRKSKRASLAFGPHAGGNTLNRRLQAHRRIASGSHIGAEDDEVATPQSASHQSTTSQGGLRELTLGGSSNGANSKRASMIGANLLRSPVPGTVDLSNDTSQGGLASTLGTLLMPSSKAARRISNSSSTSGGVQQHGNEGEVLAPPIRTASRGGNSNVSTPIIEDGNRLEEEVSTARPALATFGMGSSPNSSLTRAYGESRKEIRDQNEQIIQMRRELSIMRHHLEDEREGRKASEACLKALRDFVSRAEDKGKEDGDLEAENAGLDALRGVKLPPLPTDKDSDPDHVTGSSRAPPPSAWQAFSTTISNLSARRPTVEGASHRYTTSSARATSSASPVADKELPSPPAVSGTDAPGLSPAAQIGASFGNLWSRATTASNVPPSEGQDNFVDSPQNTTDQAPGTVTSPGTTARGFNWFAKRSISNASDATSSIGTGSEPCMSNGLRVSSPPFANLDNHVLTLDQVNSSNNLNNHNSNSNSNSNARTRTGSTAASTSTSRKTSITSSGTTPVDFEPNGRVKKAMEKSENVDEDNGFVAPVFE